MADKLAHTLGQTPDSLQHWLERQFDAAETGREEYLTVGNIETAWAPRFDRAEIEDIVIPRRTMARRKAASARLTQDETDRAVRLARIQLEADRVFADPETASLWLRTPRPSLSGQTPLSLLRTEAGAMVVSEVLGQIDHGMFV
jgi:putative toxin-antitoxin system antitoxin component (TIGR02293 family)